MSDVLRMIDIEWMNMGLKVPKEGDQVLYDDFLDHYTFQTLPSLRDSAANADNGVSSAVRSLYSNYAQMQAVFEKWDADHDGKVSREEFKKAISILNEAH